MKKLLTVFAITTALARAAYCADTAWDGLKQMGGEKNFSGSVPDSPVKMDNKAVRELSLSDLPGKTAFEKLKSLFYEGVPAQKEDLIGWYTGRVVRRSKPRELEAALLVGRPAEDQSLNVVNVDKFSCYRIKYCEMGDQGFFENMGPESIELVKKSFGYDRILDEVACPSAKVTYEDSETYTKATTQYRKARGCIVKQHVLIAVPEETVWEEYYEYYCRNVTPKGN